MHKPFFETKSSHLIESEFEIERNRDGIKVYICHVTKMVRDKVKKRKIWHEPPEERLMT